MAKKQNVLNWFAENQKFIEGLSDFYAAKPIPPRAFITIRLGSKWVDRLTPGEHIGVSISDDPKKLKVLGKAFVLSVKKVRVLNLSQSELKRNIGAKTIEGVLSALNEVYGNNVCSRSVVSVIELFPDKCPVK